MGNETRKTYVSLLTPRRTFARIKPTTKDRVDVALCLEDGNVGGRLERSHIHQSMPVQISVSSLEDLDDEALAWLERAYTFNS